MDWQIVLGFSLYVVLVVVVGVRKGWKTQTTSSDFLNSRRDHQSVLAGLSASAACESGWVLLGLVGAAYTVGVSTFWLLPGALIGYVSTWALVGSRFRDLSRSANTTSTPQTLAAPFPQFQSAILLSAGLIVAVFMSVYVAAQFNSSGKAFESMLGVPYVSGVWLSMALVLAYSLVGGTRSVSWTNVIQASMMAFALIVMPVVVLLHATSGEGLWESLQRQDPNLVSLFAGKAGLDAVSLIVSWVFIGIAVPGMPHVLRRFIAARPGREVIPRGAVVSVVWSQTIFVGAIVLGLAARAYRPAMADPEQVLPLLAIDLLPGFVAGLMLAAVWAAMSSTADAQLMEAVSAVTEDLGSVIRRLGKSKAIAHRNVAEADRKKPLRQWTVAMAVVAATLASTENRNIFTLVLDAWNVLGAALAPPILFTLLYRHTSGLGVVMGVIGGAATVFIWRYGVNITWLSPLVVGFIISSILVLVGSHIAPETGRKPTAAEMGDR